MLQTRAKVVSIAVREIFAAALERMTHTSFPPHRKGTFRGGKKLFCRASNFEMERVRWFYRCLDEWSPFTDFENDELESAHRSGTNEVSWQDMPCIAMRLQCKDGALLPVATHLPQPSPYSPPPRHTRHP